METKPIKINQKQPCLNIRYLCCLLMLFAFDASVVASSLNSSSSLSKLSLEELLSIKVVTATRSEQSLNKTPANITVFSQDQIRRLGAETLEELLAFVPGIQVARGETGGGSYTISPRGRRSDVGSNRDILLLIDGSRINEPVETGAFEQERQVSLFNAKKVEIIRGPGSALYGSNAFLAVINIETDKSANFVRVGVGTNNQQRAEFSVSKQINDFAYSLSYAHYADGGEDYPAFYEFWGKFDDTQDPAERNNFKLTANWQNWQLTFRDSHRQYDDFITLGAQLNGLQRQRMTSDLLRLEYHLESDDHQFNFYGERQESVFDYLTGLFPEDPEPLPSQVGLYWTNGSTEASLGGNYREVTQNRVGMDNQWKINSNNQLSYGLTARQEKTSLNPFQGNWESQVLEETGEYIPSSADNFIQRGFWIGGVRFDLLNPEARTVLGAYIQNEWKINDDWQATIGARHDDYEDFGSNLSIRGGLVFNQSDYYWKLLYGEAFRAPSLVETRAGIASGGISNPNLKPETVSTLELVGGLVEDYWSLNVTLYHNQFTDLIKPVLVDDVVVGITAFQPQNSGKESNLGLEFSLDIQFSDHWQLNLGGDYLIDELPDQPVAKERLFAQLNYQFDNVNINFNTHFLGKVLSRSAASSNFENNIDLKSRWLSGLNIDWQYTQETSLYLKVSNLFDEDYYSYSPQAGLETGLPNRGRFIQTGLVYQF